MKNRNGKPIKPLPICDCRGCDSYHSWPYVIMVPSKRGEKRVTLWGKQCEFNPDEINCKGICLEGQTCLDEFKCHKKEENK